MKVLNDKERVALQWLNNEIKNIPNTSSKKDIRESFTLKGLKEPPICQMVLFKYSAEKGNDFGYWDKYPLVLIVRPFEDHFFAFNLHYLDFKTRVKIIMVLEQLIAKSNGNKKMMFKLIYPFLDGLVKMKVFNSAYKNYKYDNLESKFIIIHPDHYKMIACLPIAVLKENTK